LTRKLSRSLTNLRYFVFRHRTLTATRHAHKCGHQY
jgi:hypothetical protein